MKKILMVFSIILILVPVLAACATAPVAGLTDIVQGQGSSSSSASIESKLGFGILKLEGTTQAVTNTQADTLLPLWKAVKKMGSDSTASQEEVAALYAQIQESLTSDQVAAIQATTVTPTDISEMMKKYSLVSTNSSSSSATTTSKSSSGGGPDMGGGPGGDPSMGDITGGASSTTSSSSTKAKATKSATNYNTVFASTVVTLLKEKIAKE